MAAQLAAVAYRHAPTSEARSALLDSSALPFPARHLDQGSSTHVVAATPGILATGAHNGTVTLTRAGQDAPAGPPLTVGSRAAAITLRGDGTRLAVVGENGTVRVWNTSDLAAPAELATWAGPRGNVASVAFSPDGRTVAAGGADARIHLWDLTDPARNTVLAGPQDAVTSVAFAPDGTTLAAGSRDRRVHRFTLTGPAGPVALPSVAGPKGQVFSVAISPDNRVLAAGTGSDRAVYLWDISEAANPKPLGTLTGPASWVTFIDFSPAGDRIIGGSSDRKLWEWDVATHGVRRTLPHPAVLTTAIYVDQHTVVTLAEDGITRSWPVPGPIVHGFDDTVFSASFLGPRRTLAIGPGSRDNRIHLIDATNPANPARVGTVTPGITNPGKLAGPTAANTDGTVLAAGTGSGDVHLWDTGEASRPQLLATVSVAPGATVAWLEFRADGTVLAVATKDGTVTLVDVADPRRPAKLAAKTESGKALNDVRFTPDGKLLVTGSDDGNAYLYDIADAARPRLRLRATLPVGNAATSIAINRNGTTLAVGAAADDNVHLWDLTGAGQPRPIGGSLDGPVADLHQLAFHPERDELAAASIDGTVWLWNLTDPHAPEHTATITASADAAMTLAYTHDGAQLAVGTRDGTVRLWRTDLDATLRWLCTAAGTSITPTEWEQFLPGTPYAPPCA
nr:WD40 repeat domain-containing protein [Kibdelosporangium phytohabitans]